MPKMQNLTGMRFGRLLVVSQAEHNGKHIQWNTQCDCGNTKVIPTTNLVRGRSTSCGCLRKEVARERMTGSTPPRKLPEGHSALNILFSQYRRGAEARDLLFDLSLSELAWITKLNCYYCGAPPSQSISRRSSNGAYIYNGVDRLDNEHGYHPWNVVPCCGVCNRMKMALNYPEFIARIERIYLTHGKEPMPPFPR